MAIRSFPTYPSRHVGCAFLLALSACSGGEPAENAAEVQKATTKPGDIALTNDNIRRLGLRFAAAKVATEAPIAVVPAVIAPPPNARVAVGAIFPGVVSRTLVVEGETVRKGQALAIVTSRDVLTMGADLSRASARLGLAQTNANRMAQLNREGIIAGSRAEEAQAGLSEARADVSEKSRILRMVNASRDGGTYTLTAPIAGKVTAATIHAGSVIDGASAPYVIDAEGQYEAQAQLPERLAGQVKPGMSVVLDGMIRGTVTAVGSTIDPATRSVALKARLPAGPGTMAGKATSLALFGPAPEGAVTVAQAAVSTIGDRDAVFVRNANGVSMRRVTTGGKDGDRILILSGLKPGEQVVVSGISALKPLAQGE